MRLFVFFLVLYQSAYGGCDDDLKKLSTPEILAQVRATAGGKVNAKPDIFALPEVDMEPMRDNNGEPVNFLTYDYAAHKRWNKHRPLGTTFADAQKAMEVDSYKTSKEIQRYELTPEEEYSLARVAARNHGAIFSELVTHYPRLTELQRFQVGLIAARFNSWGNVKFDVDAFGLSNQDHRLNLIRVALKRSDEQLKYLGEWGLDRPTLFELFKVAAQYHGLEAFRYLNPLGKLSPAEHKDLYLAMARGRKHYDLSKAFEASDLPLMADRFELAQELAKRGRYFAQQLPNFTLSVEDPRYRAVVQQLLQVKDTKALWYAENLHLSDRELVEAYFTMRDRDNIARRSGINDDGNTYAHQEIHDPIELLERVGKLDLPEFERPGAPDEEGFGITFSVGDKVIFDSKTEELLAEPKPQKVNDLRKLAKKRPDLLPESWVTVGFEKYKNRHLTAELIRQSYRLSKPGEMLEPKHSLDIATRAVGMNSGNFSPDSYGLRPGWNLHVELLSLAHTFDKPAFEGVAVDPRLLDPQNVERFTQFIHDLRMRLHHDSKEIDMFEWDRWLRLKAKLKLKKVGISLENLDSLSEEISKRPRPRNNFRSLPPI